MDRHNPIIVDHIDCDLWPWQMLTLRPMLEVYGSHKGTTMKVLVCEGLRSPSLLRRVTRQIGAASIVSRRFGLRQMNFRAHPVGVAVARSLPEVETGVTCPPGEPVDFDLECLIQWTAAWVYQPPPDQITPDVGVTSDKSDTDTAGLR